MVSSFSQHRSNKGQGLIIYIIILALIAMVVIGITRLLGSRMGDPSSAIDHSANESAGDVTITVSFEADDLYWNNPANGCNQNYTYGMKSGCDDIIDRVHACMAGASGSYCEDYFAVSPR